MVLRGGHRSRGTDHASGSAYAHRMGKHRRVKIIDLRWKQLIKLCRVKCISRFRRYVPYPGGGEKWGANGVGDDLYSFGFDGTHLWTGNVGRGEKKVTIIIDREHARVFNRRQKIGSDAGFTDVHEH